MLHSLRVVLHQKSRLASSLAMPVGCAQVRHLKPSGMHRLYHQLRSVKVKWGSASSIVSCWETVPQTAALALDGWGKADVTGEYVRLPFLHFCCSEKECLQLTGADHQLPHHPSPHGSCPSSTPVRWIANQLWPQSAMPQSCNHSAALATTGMDHACWKHPLCMHAQRSNADPSSNCLTAKELQLNRRGT
jgi:hypothetical protein